PRGRVGGGADRAAPGALGRGRPVDGVREPRERTRLGRPADGLRAVGRTADEPRHGRRSGAQRLLQTPRPARVRRSARGGPRGRPGAERADPHGRGPDVPREPCPYAAPERRAARAVPQRAVPQRAHVRRGAIGAVVQAAAARLRARMAADSRRARCPNRRSPATDATTGGPRASDCASIPARAAGERARRGCRLRGRDRWCPPGRVRVRAPSHRVRFSPAPADGVSPHPTCSVIVPTYRRPQALRRCVEAIAGQAYPATRLELVVADDGEDDGLPDLLAPFRGRVELTLVRSGRRGPAAARNAAAAVAGGELLAFTDDDCEPDPGWLAALASPRDGAPVAVGGRTL